MAENKNMMLAPGANAFLGLQSYAEAQAGKFFGRDAEIEALTSLVNLNTLTIVFGKSGTGKTSLLNAGVFPRLRKNYCLPFRIRFSFDEKSPELVTQIKNVLKEEIDKYGFKPEAYPGNETLWEYFHKEPLWFTVTPILVFDQFEEIFTLAKSNPRFAGKELPAFWKELSDLIENTIPEELKEKFLKQKEETGFNRKRQKAKIVFAFREEYLPEFESLATQIPSLKYSRFRLLPMNGLQANEVITKTWKENISAKEARQIVSYFTNEPGLEDESLVTVEPSLLSQVCAYIDKGRIEKGGGKVSAELLSQYPKDKILAAIYEEAVTAANDRLPADTEQKKKLLYNPVKVFLEERLITSEGYRTRYNLSGNDESLRPAINELNSRYFIREDDNAIELTHDVVAPVIKTDREKRRKEISLAAERKRARKKAFVILLASLILGAGALAYFTNKAAIAIENKKDAERDKRIADSLAGEARTEMINYQEQLKNDKKALKAEAIRDLKNKDSSAVIIAELLARIKYLDSLRNAGYKVSSDTSIAALQIQIRILDSVIGVLNADITTKADTIKNKNARLLYLDLEKLKIQRDLAAALGKIKSMEADLTRKENELTVLRSRINGLISENARLLADKKRMEAELEYLRADTLLKSNEIKELKKKIAAAKKNEVYNQNLKSAFDGNLRIQVYDKSTEYKVPITDTIFDVYIIPYKGNNKDILDNNKGILFTKDCNGFNQLIPKLSGWQKAYFKNGYYYFHDIVKNGKYKVKICNILDGYFDLKMPSPSGKVFWRQNEKEKIAIELGHY